MKPLFLALIFSSALQAREVLDLGKIEVKARARGPEVHLIESNQLSSQFASKMMAPQLKDLETELLNPMAPTLIYQKRGGSHEAK